MKKSKVAIAIVLAIILVILCVNVPTFSWFSRPQSQDGERMMLDTKNAYTAYSGKNVTIATYPSDDGFNYSSTATTDYDGSGILSHKRRYFCTTITNSAASAQAVSLYASKLSIPITNTNGTLALGLNGPTRSYRDYSDWAQQSFSDTRDSMRIYFEKDNSVAGWGGTEFYVCWKIGSFTDTTLGSDGTYYKLSWCGDPGHPNHYYADIPKTATQAFFAVENWGTSGDNGDPDYTLRSQICTDLASDGLSQTSAVLYKITSGWNNGNHTVAHYSSPGACIKNYYTSITVPKGSSHTFNAGLVANTDYIGGTITYTSSDTNVFTVNSSGVIQGINAGEATLTTEVTNSGGYYDKVKVTTTIKVTDGSYYEFSDVPIVTNLIIPAGSTENVYWYVINNSDDKALDYLISSLYVGM